jgi:hypothetical protein
MCGSVLPLLDTDARILADPTISLFLEDSKLSNGGVGNSLVPHNFRPRTALIFEPKGHAKLLDVLVWPIAFRASAGDNGAKILNEIRGCIAATQDNSFPFNGYVTGGIEGHFLRHNIIRPGLGRRKKQ